MAGEVLGSVLPLAVWIVSGWSQNPRPTLPDMLVMAVDIRYTHHYRMRKLASARLSELKRSKWAVSLAPT